MEKKMLTIKDVAARVGESEHTIRYYCKEGLFPFLVRDKNNIRKFTEEDLEGVRIVLCLRDTGMPLSEIKRYMDLCAKGSSTIKERLEIIRSQKEKAYRQMQEFQEKIDHLEWKEQHYMELIENGMKDDCNPLDRREDVRKSKTGKP